MTNKLAIEEAVEIKPCPFCGKPPTIVCPDNSYGSAMVTCGDMNECPVDLTAWGDLNTGETIEDAKRAWNTRALIIDEEKVARALCRQKANEGGIWFDDAALNKHIDNNWRSFKPQARAALSTLVHTPDN